jgi:hypothetical protein
MDTTLSADNHMVATGSFKYDYFLVQKV